MCLILNEDQMNQILKVAMASEKKTKEGIYYRYVGDVPQRDFCQKLIALDNLYSKAEIDQMSFRGENRSFGHKQRPYSIFKYRGGVNCKHFWMKVELKKNKQGKLIEKNLGIVSKEPVGHYPLSNEQPTTLLSVLRKLNQI